MRTPITGALRLAVLAAALLLPAATYGGTLGETLANQTVTFTTLSREAKFDSKMFLVTPDDTYVPLITNTVGSTVADVFIPGGSRFKLYVQDTGQWFGENRVKNLAPQVWGWEDWNDWDYNDLVFRAEATAPVPEPSTWLVVVAGLGLIALRWPKTKRPCRPGW